MDLLALLGTGDIGADHTWVLRHALSYLERLDATKLIVAVLERGGRDARRHVHWLRCGDAPIPLVDENELLEQAAAHACSRALKILLEDLKARSPPWTALHDERMEEVLAFTTTAFMEHATVAHCGTHYRFGVDVIKAAAARGYLDAVQWLLPRSTRQTGQVEPPQREPEDIRYMIAESLRSAGNARQLHVVGWIVHAFPHLDCVVPYDEDLQAVAWIVRNDRDLKWSEYCSATSKHGFSSTTGYTYPDDEPFTDRMTNLPLADGFAADGDLATLEKMYAKPNHRHLIGNRAIEQAASRGHVHVVQWLYERLPHTLTAACISIASRNGHVAILQWMQQPPQQYDLSMFSASVVSESVRYGHVNVLKWFASLDESTRSAVCSSALLAVAIQYGHVDVATFLHEDCELAMKMKFVMDALVYGQNASVKMYSYVLDRIGPLRREHEFLERVINQRAPLEVVQHLVLTRGFWSREAFAAATSSGNLAVVQFIYAQAQTRAKDLDTTLSDQLDLSSIAVGKLWTGPMAEWLVTLPEAFPVWGPVKPTMDDGFLTSPGRRQMLLACLRQRPLECRSVEWLPTWAVRIHSYETLELLAASDHPHLRDAATFQAILQYSRDARFLLKLLPLPKDYGSLAKAIVAWAATFGLVAVLDSVLDDREVEIQLDLFNHVMQHRGFSAHLGVVDWLLERGVQLVVASITVIQAIAMDAARHGHTASLAYLTKRQLLRGLAVQLKDSLVTHAARGRQVHSLEWLLGNVAVSTELVAHTLLEAVQSNHTEIVAFITGRYAPSELPVADDDRVRICGFLKKRPRPRSGTEDAVAVLIVEREEVTQKEETRSSTGRRKKRARRKW